MPKPSLNFFHVASLLYFYMKMTGDLTWSWGWFFILLVVGFGLDMAGDVIKLDPDPPESKATGKRPTEGTDL